MRHQHPAKPPRALEGLHRRGPPWNDTTGVRDRRLGAWAVGKVAEVVAVLALAVLAGCASRAGVAARAKGQEASAAHAPAGDAFDGSACQRICAASAACGDSQSLCTPKCNDWLVARSRPGIATAAARCAVPRIDMACEHEESARGAANALVYCIDDAGRAALTRDNSSLLVAARAICDRGARCGSGSPDDADRCVAKITFGGAPRGLGVFGAIKPDIVHRFAVCMNDSDCGPSSGAATCFGQMLGEERPSESDDEALGGTKI